MPDLPLPLLIVLGTGLASLLGGAVVRGRRSWSTLAVVGFAGAMVSLAFESKPDPLRWYLDWLLVTGGFAASASLAGLPAHRRDLFASHPEGGLVPGLLVLAVGGAMLIGHAPDTVGWVVGLELAIVPVGVLLLRTAGDVASRASALRYVTVELVGFFAVVGGTAVVFAEDVGADSLAVELGAVLLLAGLAIRARVAPFGAGSEDVHAGTSAWAAGVIALVPRLAVGAFLVRSLPRLAEVANEATRTVAIVVGVVSILGGGISALFRTNVRSVLAAATSSLFGVVFLGVVVAAWDVTHPAQSLDGRDSFPAGRGVILLQLVHFAVVTVGLHAVLVHVTRPERPVDFEDDLTGLGRTEPAAAASLVVLCASAFGAPPLAGFWARLSAVYAVSSTWSAPGLGRGPMVTAASPMGRGLLAFAGLAIALGGVLLAMAFARWLVTILFDQPRTGVRPSGGEPALAVAVLTAMLAVGLGLIPGPLFGWIRAIVGTVYFHL